MGIADPQGILQIQTKQTRLLYERLSVGLIATSVNAIILTLVLWPYITHQLLVAWLFCIEVVALLRYLMLREYRSISQLPVNDRDWGKRFLYGTLASGICWGSAGILLFAHDSIAHQTFLAFVLGGMTAGAVTAYSSRMAVILSFILPALTPITVRFFVEGAELQLAMGAMSLLFLVLMLESGHRVHKTTLKTLTLEVENQELIAHLSAETKRARDLNKELELEIAERQEAEEKLKKVRDSLEERVEVRTTQLRLAMEKVKVLRGLLPICSGCKKIRDDQGYWTQLEVFIGEHSEAEFTHGLCPSCAKELYPGYIEGGR